MNSNQRRNKIAIDKFRKELHEMFDDISDIDVKVLNRAVNEGVKDAKENTNTVSGHMKKSWRALPAIKRKNRNVSKTMVNSADYSSYVNYGHRIVNSKGETVGFVKGQFMLERAIHKIDNAIEREFKKEVERVNRKHDK